ncbi:carboxymuconolactone decarboxylase family protein [Capillimicrobium parvum]|uniref:Carboxymuconolactone decarboxylase-like domain-containing protein n=1 Tax=Capillimicrobium parvum TaxID=2884022 RepID=A0A9E6Y2K2_9ACTN|nr:hypothetical protein [Capillimicrobium parvum]UGS38301.1 hypothetical protein DSM104329_04725 [Capillimicrobium parvum]
MPRLRPIERAQAAAEAQPYYDRDVGLYGVVLNNTKMYAHNVPVLLAVKEFVARFSEATTLPTDLKALLRVRVALLNGCPF